MTNAYLLGVSLGILAARPFTWILVDESTPYDFPEATSVRLDWPNHPGVWDDTYFQMTRTITGSTSTGPSWASWVGSITNESYNETIPAGTMYVAPGEYVIAAITYKNNHGWQKWGDNSSSPPAYVQRWRNWWKDFVATPTAVE